MIQWFIADLKGLPSNPRFRLAVVAMTMGGTATMSLLVAPNALGLLGAMLAIIVVLIAFFDLNYFVIPNWLNAGGFLLGLVYAGLSGNETIIQTVAVAAMRGLVCASLFFALRVLYEMFRGRQGLGLGDVKLAAVAGVWLNWFLIPVAIQIAAFVALSAYLLRQFATGRSLSAKSRMPFGLFFAPAIWICWILQSRWMAFF